MRFQKSDKQNGWELSFAWLPVSFEEWVENDEGKDEKVTTTIWLEKYWSRFEGLYTNIRKFEDKPI
jgi:hypothetical protein